MAPSAIPNTTFIENPAHEPTDCRECLLNHRLKTPTNKTNNNEHKIIDVYEEVRDKNESKFLQRVRQWEKEMGFMTPLQWTNIFFITLLHIIAPSWFLWNIFTGKPPSWYTVIYTFTVGQIAGFGVTGGVHRYWCHRSYKAKIPLQLFLAICFSISGQNSIYNWVRDHRVHHKFSETSADPHDANRGFFFAHVGWLMMKKHPAVLREGAKIDMSDIINDPLIQFHSKYFVWFKILFCFVLPTLVPVYLWNATWEEALLSLFVRYTLNLNFTWSVNSFAHLWGNKPYDRHIMPSENWGVSVVAMGEGWHNYHHTFPWDYKAAELAYSINVTTMLLDFFWSIGWAYDMKQASKSLVQTVTKNRGEQPQEYSSDRCDDPSQK